MSYLSSKEVQVLERHLKTFFSLPYSTDLDGKDAETLIRIVKGSTGPRSKRKELFDIIDGTTGYSVKTLFKSPSAMRVDLQEQRFCEVTEVRQLRLGGGDTAAVQGAILLKYMHDRITEQMKERDIEFAKSLILLKHWNSEKTKFNFVYWEEDFLGFVKNLQRRNSAGEIEWVVKEAGLHARDKLRPGPPRSRTDTPPDNIRLLRMHYKHNQIFTDHDIPQDVVKIAFDAESHTWDDLAKMIELYKAMVSVAKTKV